MDIFFTSFDANKQLTHRLFNILLFFVLHVLFAYLTKHKITSSPRNNLNIRNAYVHGFNYKTKTATCYTSHANYNFRHPRVPPPKLVIILTLDEEAWDRKRVQLLQGNGRTMRGPESVWGACASQGRREVDSIPSKKLNFMNTLKPDRGNCPPRRFVFINNRLLMENVRKVDVECFFKSRLSALTKLVFILVAVTIVETIQFW